MPKQFIKDFSTTGHKEVIGETIAKFVLYRNGFNPYTRFLDIEAIDLIIRNSEGNKVTYNEIQVKYSKKQIDFFKKKNPVEWYWFGINKNTFKPRQNFYFMFICDTEDLIFIIPSLDLASIFEKIDSVKETKRCSPTIYHKENEYFFFITRKGGEENITKYKNNFDLLK